MSDVLYCTAVHEAAHAVVAVLTAIGKQHGLAKNGVVTIERGGDTLGHVAIKKSGSGDRRRRRSLMIDLAGGIAGCRVDPSDNLEEIAAHMRTDTITIINSLGKLRMIATDETGRDVAAVYWREQGMDEEWLHHSRLGGDECLLTKKIRLATAVLCKHGNGMKAAQAIVARSSRDIGIVSEPWFKVLGDLTDKTSALLDKHWSKVHQLANRLLERGTIPGPEAEAMVKEVRA